jgi:type I restriction enzyme S subunit
VSIISNFVRLGDYVRVRTGKLDANASSPNGAYPFFTCSQQPLRISSFSYDCECVLVAGNGDLNIKYYAGKFDAYQRTYIIEALDNTKLHVRYLFYFLARYVERLRAMSIGGVIKYIKLDYLTEAKIPLPDVQEQRRIAEVLDRAEGLRAKRRATLAQLDILTQSIFLDLFGDPATNPKGFPVATIGEIGTVITGNTPSREKPEYFGTAIEWIKSDNINTPHYYLTQATEGLSEMGKSVARTAPPNSILVTCIAGSPDCIGNAAMTDREVAFNQQINALVPHKAEPHFIYAQLRVGKRLIRKASTDGMKDMVTKSRFEKILLPSPPIALQHDFARQIVAVEKAKAKNGVFVSGLDSLFSSLQHRAFRGEL